MEFVILAIVGFLTSLLTFFSGFGLGTLLTPAFIFFFPLDIAIAMTAMVHFANNLFKLSLMWPYIDWNILKYFGPFCIIGAFLGAFLLTEISDVEPVINYELASFNLEITLLNLIIGSLMLLFAYIELNPRFALKNIKLSMLWLGGLLSGFFGGLSGHQGALRSMFLIKSNLDKEQFIASGVAIACLVDITRISIYSEKMNLFKSLDSVPMILAALLPAFVGAFLGRKLLKKITFEIIHKYVAWMLIIIALGIISGFL